MDQIEEYKMVNIIQFVLILGGDQYAEESIHGMIDFYASIIDELFSDDELEEIVAFGKTSAGRKLFKDLRMGVLSSDLTDEELLTYDWFWNSKIGHKYDQLSKKTMDKMENRQLKALGR